MAWMGVMTDSITPRAMTLPAGHAQGADPWSRVVAGLEVPDFTGTNGDRSVAVGRFFIPLNFTDPKLQSVTITASIGEVRQATWLVRIF